MKKGDIEQTAKFYYELNTNAKWDDLPLESFERKLQLEIAFNYLSALESLFTGLNVGVIE